jgi:predicted negative regulator of RcsB-dependent stress response
VFSSDEEALEAIKSWWREYGTFVVLGIAIGLAGVGGWQFYHASEARQAQESAQIYRQVIMSISFEDHDAARDHVQALRENYRRSPYAALAGLQMARHELGHGEHQMAADHLRWVTDNARDRELRGLARVRLARVLIDKGDAEAALELLGGAEAGRFAVLYEEARGDAHFALGDRLAAREAYRRALAAAEEGDLESRPELEMKYQDLAPEGS